MKKSLIIFAAAGFALLSCAKQDPQPQAPEVDGTPEQTPETEYLDYITVASPGAELPAAKTVTTDGVKVLWSNGDQIGLYAVVDADGNGSYANPGERDMRAIYTTSLSEPSPQATFGRVADPAPVLEGGLYLAVYPQSAVEYWSSPGGANKRAYVTVPKEQTAVKGGWDPRAGILAASSANKTFAFRHVMAYVKFTVDASTPDFVSMSVVSSSTTLADNKATLTFGADNAASLVPYASSSEKSNEIVLTNGGSAFADGDYYVAFIAGNFSSGLTLKFTNAAGEVAMLNVSGPLVLNAGDVYDYGSVSAISFAPAVTVDLPQLYNSDGIKGVAFYADPADPSKMKIVSGAVTYVAWLPNGEAFETAATIDTGNSAANHAHVTGLSDYSAEKYPAVAFCAGLGAGWHLPSEAELNAMYQVYYGLSTLDTTTNYLEDTQAQANAAVFDGLLGQCVTDDASTAYNETKLNLGQTGATWYWSGQGSTSDKKIRRVKLQTQYTMGTAKPKNECYVRCVREVEMK